MPIRPSQRPLYPPPREWRELRARILERAGHACECRGEYVLVRVILTISHRDHNPENNSLGNLAALCQRCHLRYDRTHHAETRRATRDARAGQGRLVP